jgi:hypothetical protein
MSKKLDLDQKNFGEPSSVRPVAIKPAISGLTAAAKRRFLGARNVVGTIANDKAKTQAYCQTLDLARLKRFKKRTNIALVEDLTWISESWKTGGRLATK